jgi:hypothetical protein
MTTRRWLYVVGGLLGVLVIVVAVVLVTRDDGSGSSASTTTTTTSTVPPTTTTPASTSTSTTPTTAPPTTAAPGTTVPLPPITEDPQSYAEFLFAAWQNGNRTQAAQVASADAVDQIFAQPWTPGAEWTFDRCGPAAGSLYCTWTSANGPNLVMTVRTLTGGLPIQVVGVQYQTP